MARRDAFFAPVTAAASRQRQRGYLMVVSLLIILLITIMSISMAKSFFQEEGMAGNIREKSRSFAAAQAGLRYGEWAAQQNGISQGGNCASSGALATLAICNNAYTPATSTGVAPMQASWTMPTPPASIATFSNSAITKDTYYALPGIYVQWEGSNTANAVYLITAVGYGGTSNSMSVVQSQLWVHCTNPSGQPGAGCG